MKKSPTNSRISTTYISTKRLTSALLGETLPRIIREVKTAKRIANRFFPETSIFN